MPINTNLQLSIVLPIYNVELYLEKCIRSLEDQDLEKNTYEIICVNDGSPDNSKQVIEKLQQEFSNIILINQENKGVSVARNVGIKQAKGNYLLFVDPDDSLQTNCLSSLLNYAETNNYEVVFSPFTFVEINGGQKESKYSDGLEKLMDGPTLYHAVRGKEIVDPDRSVAILYKKELLSNNELEYIKNIPYLEDGEFIARVLCLTQRGSVYNKPYYLRLNRPGSATKSNLSIQLISIKGFFIALNSLVNFKEKRNLNEKQKEFLNQPICKFVLLAIHACVSKVDIKKFKFVKKEIQKKSLVKLDLKGCNARYTKLGRVYNRSINYFFVYLIFKNGKNFINARLLKNNF